ncbi:hypothetical protein D3C78_1592470 [compost metagenome]
MQHLTLQVGYINRVEIGQVQLSDTGSCQVQGHRRAQAAEPDNQCAAVLQAHLAVDIDLSQEDLPAVAQQFLIT